MKRRARPHLLGRGLAAGALVIAAAVFAPSLALAADDPADEDSGRLSLNTDVLVDESVGSGVSGDFALRGALFSAELYAREQGAAAAAAERLNAAKALDFAPRADVDIQHRAAKDRLFDIYSPAALPRQREEAAQSTALPGIAIAVSAPIAIGLGALAGAAWARRKRKAS